MIWVLIYFIFGGFVFVYVKGPKPVKFIGFVCWWCFMCEIIADHISKDWKDKFSQREADR